MKDEALTRMLAEIEHEINEHPIREKLKIWKWIVYCNLTNNKIINKLKQYENEKVKRIISEN